MDDIYPNQASENVALTLGDYAKKQDEPLDGDNLIRGEFSTAIDAETDEEVAIGTPTHDPIHHPRHYTSHPSGVECIQVTEHFNFNLGNVIKYVWRAGLKNSVLENLLKAQWYLAREIDRLETEIEKCQIR